MFNSDHAACRPVLSPRRTLSLAAGLAFTIVMAAAAPSPVDVMPAPAEARLADGRLPVTTAFSIALAAHPDARLSAATDRLLQAWETRTGLHFGRAKAAASAATLVIDCASPGPALPELGEDESYTLDVTPRRATLRAPTPTGALRGLATVQQLLAGGGGGFFLPAVRIRDRPRFPWRGLMIDVARHWQPIEVIERNLDGMALVKLNVLHLHLSDDQGFRIESRTHPELQARGSDGHFFTQDQIRTIIAAARERGIRVVPEFDLPGHATSWVVSHPELASQPGPYAIERHWGVFDPVLDPTNEALYALLDDFIGEMAALFPDPVFHIGGDENNGVQWSANPRIQAFIREHHLHDNEGLHAYFNRRIATILARHGKRLAGWDEILHPGLPADSIIQSWRGTEALAAAARQGYSGLLSNGYYLDLMYPASAHYRQDPLPASTPLAPAGQKRILGGEATMWSEWVSPATIDSRIWPRAAAIAERLWSPRDVTDVSDMYRRLALVSARLDEAGLLHEKNYQARLRTLAGEAARPSAFAAVQTVVGLLEPVKGYQRGQLQPEMTQRSPLDRLADYARPDSASARAFSTAVDRFLFQAPARDAADATALTKDLETWIAAAQEIAGSLATAPPALREGAPQIRALADLGSIGVEALAALRAGHTPEAAWFATARAALDRAAQPCPTATELMIVKPLRLLVFAAIEQDHRATLPAAAWRHRVQTAAFPEPAPAASP
jgi:hexosaminidase